MGEKNQEESRWERSNLMNLLDDLFRAYYEARVNKRNTINQLKFELNLEQNLYQLANDISKRTYNLSPSIAFIVFEPTVREIFAASFRDRVVHHLIFDYINPFWERRFITDSYSCRKGRGTHYGHKRIKRFLRAVSDNYTREAWILKLDILGYFMHMRRQTVWEKCLAGLQKQMLANDGETKDTLAYLMHKVIFADPTQNVIIKGNWDDWQTLPTSKSLFWAETGCGFPIGNLTSQLFSNIYLHELDLFVKHQLGFKFYGRYVDDFVLMHQDRYKLVVARAAIDQFLRQRLGLTLHPKKYYLQPYQRGVSFLGGKIKPYCILPGQRLVGKFKLARKLNYAHSQPQSWQSYVGHLRQFASWRLQESGGG